MDKNSIIPQLSLMHAEKAEIRVKLRRKRILTFGASTSICAVMLVVAFTVLTPYDGTNTVIEDSHVPLAAASSIYYENCFECEVEITNSICIECE